MANDTILLVEDNPDHEALTVRALKKAGLANPVVVAHDGAEALDFLFGKGQYAGRSPAETPQVVLLDLKLPKLDGLEVLERMRADERFQLIPVVVLTSSDEETDLLRSYKLGANSYIRKPVDFSNFIEVTRQLGFYWLLLNEAPRAARG
jgi:two-component system response regulator